MFHYSRTTPASCAEQRRRTTRSELLLARAGAAFAAPLHAQRVRDSGRTRVVRRLSESPARVARLARTVALLGLLSWATAGCVSAKPKSHTIAIRDFQYVPDSVIAQVGDTLVWTNDDIVPHTATVKTEELDTGSIESKQAWRFVATRPGTYRYRCAFHPDMQGMLIVR